MCTHTHHARVCAHTDHAGAMGLPSGDVFSHCDRHGVVAEEISVHLVRDLFLNHIHLPAVPQSIAETELRLAIQTVAIGAIATAFVRRVELRAKLRRLSEVIFACCHHMVTCIAQNHIKCRLVHWVVMAVAGNPCFVVLAARSQTRAGGRADGCRDVSGSEACAERSHLARCRNMEHRTGHTNLGIKIFDNFVCNPLAFPIFCVLQYRSI